MVMKFLGSVLRPARSEAIAKHLRLCAAALPASGVWRGLSSAEKRELFQSVLARGAGAHMAGFASYDALRSVSPVRLPNLDTIGRDDLSLYLEAAATAVESLAETLAPFAAASSPPPLIAVAGGDEGEVLEGEFEDDDEDDDEDEFEDDEFDDEDDDESGSPRSW